MKHEICINHDDHAAVERCEVCAEPLCGLCLWYSDDGRRLCERHAAALADEGERVLPPETYEEAIPTSLRPASPAARLNRPGLYIGNRNDLVAFLAAVASITTLLSCAGGAYCLPFMAGLAGIAAYLNADKAEDPRRTRIFGMVGLAGMMLILLAILAFVLFYVFIFGVIALSSP